MNQQESGSAEFNRRDFLRGGSVAAMMAMMGGVELFAQTNEQASAESKPAGAKVKCAVIGLGAWGREIMDQLGRLPQVEIAAICDNYPAMVRRSGSKAPNATQTDDYKTILENKDIKAVFIATPTHLHKGIAIAALQAGKHVYCEAPLANTVEDAKAIALAAKNSPQLVFQSGLQFRSDPQRHFLLPFIRSGATGKPVMARAQFHKKQSWRAASPNPEREKVVNWRLDKSMSSGLIGEIGIHQLDQAAWLFMDAAPVSVTGFGSNVHWKDGRDVPDTVQSVLEFPGGARMIYDATLANSFDGEYEMFYGSDAAIMVRDRRAWMFKEVDSPLLGWEVYAKKDVFYKENGIALMANASKQTAYAETASDSPYPFPTVYYALEAFVLNCVQTIAAVEDYSSMFDVNDKAALANYLTTLKFKPAANYKDGYVATALAIKANEAVVKGERIELKKEWFELA